MDHGKARRTGRQKIVSAKSFTMAWLLFCAGTAMSADFGRMFFTPEQRATLDDARKKNLRIEIGRASCRERVCLLV